MSRKVLLIGSFLIVLLLVTACGSSATPQPQGEYNPFAEKHYASIVVGTGSNIEWFDNGTVMIELVIDGTLDDTLLRELVNTHFELGVKLFNFADTRQFCKENLGARGCP